MAEDFAEHFDRQFQADKIDMPTILTETQIRNGGSYEMSDSEEVMFDVGDTAKNRTEPLNLSDGRRILFTRAVNISAGNALGRVATIGDYVDSDQLRAAIDSGDVPTERQFAAYLNTSSSTPNVILLEPGQVYGIGRGIEGQGDLADTVAPYQFDISADKYGWITVTNKTDLDNPTIIQAFF